MNVLLTCAGRRNYLLRYFREALAGRGKVYAADLSPHSPVLIEAGPDSFTAPAVEDPGYFDFILKRCQDLKIGMLLSLNDFELPGLARQADRFRAAGVVCVVSPPQVVDLCFDKWATFQKLSELGIPTPTTVLSLEEARKALASGALSFPLAVKPRWGTASVCVELVSSDAELGAAHEWISRKLARSTVGKVGGRDRLLIQQGLSGSEFGVDIINDLEGRHHAVIVKKKLSMRAGETDRAETIVEERVATLARRIGESLGHCGLMDCDAFITPQGPFLLELNPRFGGGYPFSHAAGADVPAALLAWAAGEKARPEWLTAKPGVFAAKCDRLVSS